MLMLPPTGPSQGADRRVRARRTADRKSKGVAGAEAAGFDPALEPDVIGDIPKRDPRRQGRRASDRRAATETQDGGIVRAPRPHAPLVAQLIATALDMEQTRARRRGSLGDAVALYAPKRKRVWKSRGEV